MMLIFDDLLKIGKFNFYEKQKKHRPDIQLSQYMLLFFLVLTINFDKIYN